MLKVAIYGKGGIGKSTVTSNLAAAFANMGKRVIQIGCDPKADSTINLLGGEPLRPVMNYMREEDEEPDELAQISKEGYGGILCIEAGGPTPGLAVQAAVSLRHSSFWKTWICLRITSRMWCCMMCWVTWSVAVLQHRSERGMQRKF